MHFINNSVSSENECLPTQYAIILINNDLSSVVLEKIQKQLQISETYYGSIIEDLAANDSNYINSRKAEGKNILVIRGFNETINKDIYDIVIFVKLGLASIEKNNLGPPGATFQVDRLYLKQLIINKNT